MYVPQNITSEVPVYNMSCKKVDSICDFGVRFDSKLSFPEHTNDNIIAE